MERALSILSEAIERTARGESAGNENRRGKVVTQVELTFSVDKGGLVRRVVGDKSISFLDFFRSSEVEFLIKRLRNWSVN